MAEQEAALAAPAAPAAVAPAAPSAPAPEAPAASGAPAPTSAESAPAAPEGSDKPETPEQAEKRGQSRFNRKIDRLHRRAAEAEARAQIYEKQLAEVRQQQAPKDDPTAPRMEQFDDIEKYAKAKAEYESKRVLNEHTAKQAEESQKQYTARVASEWEERVERAVEKYEDFTEVVGEIKPTNPLAVAIMRAENGEDVAYHLGKNLKEAQRIAGLDPISQVFELGKLSAKLSAEPKKPPQPSKAPAPINPLNGASSADPNTPSETDEIGAWIKKRQRQVHGARR